MINVWIDDFQAVYIVWMCASPQNNKMLCDNPKYTGVGGHLFAMPHPYQIAIYENESADIRKVYDYEWPDEEKIFVNVSCALKRILSLGG